ncbi:MAG: hypothetical protein HY560_02685, partial [Gemmatimonadetes bacterium]|nr:hypothetical protein [Gemmatimonadota bacterium]
VWLVPREEETLYLASAVGPPGLDFAEGPPLEFLVRRAPGSGAWVQLYARRPTAVQEVQLSGAQVRVRRTAKHTDVIDLKGREARIATGPGSKVLLRGARERPGDVRTAAPPAPRIEVPLLLQAPTLDEWDATIPPEAFRPLGAAEYRRSEEPYVASEFSARVATFGAGRFLYFALDVTKPMVVARPPDAPDPGLDNEPPEIHSDGVQLYVGREGWEGCLLIPDLHSAQVYIRPVRGTAGDVARLGATWGRTASGYRMLIRYDTGRRLSHGDEFAVNLVVNQMLPGRERRAGQLALGGGGGWVYLRGDRESPEGAVVVKLT